MRNACGILLLSLFGFSCATDLEKIKEISDDSALITERGKDIEILYSELGQLKAKVIAPELIRVEDKKPYTEFNAGLKLNFYNPNMEIESRLSANYGIYYQKTEEMKVRDDVVLTNIKGDKLNTEELIWKRKEEKITSDKFVKITTDDEIIYGTGFEAKQDFSEYMIKNISGIISVEDDEFENNL